MENLDLKGKEQAELLQAVEKVKKTIHSLDKYKRGTDLEQLAKQFDYDHNGVLSSMEFMDFLDSVTALTKLTESEKKILTQVADTDKNDEISLEEFFDFVKHQLNVVDVKTKKKKRQKSYYNHTGRKG